VLCTGPGAPARSQARPGGKTLDGPRSTSPRPCHLVATPSTPLPHIHAPAAIPRHTPMTPPKPGHPVAPHCASSLHGAPSPTSGYHITPGPLPPRSVAPCAVLYILDAVMHRRPRDESGNDRNTFSTVETAREWRYWPRMTSASWDRPRPGENHGGRILRADTAYSNSWC
jgi:hypothetical protein